MPGAQRLQVREARLAAVLPVADVVELALVGRGAAAGEGAGRVRPAGDPREAGWWSVALPIDGEDHPAVRVGEDAGPLGRGADEPGGRLEIDGAEAVDLRGSLRPGPG